MNWFRSILWLVVAFLSCSFQVPAREISSATLTASVEANGGYQLSDRVSGWQLGGNLPGPATGLVSSAGKDNAGAYHQLAFTFKESDRPMAGFIRLYDGHELALFSQTAVQASATPPMPFPDFTTLPKDLFSFSYQDNAFSSPQFKLDPISAPWMSFNAAGDALVISPASHFICASMVGDGKTEMGSGFNKTLANLPAGFTQQTLVVLGHGINHLWDVWGQGMTDLQGKKRPANDADPFLKYFGYWTDNGAAYWYNYDAAKGYQGTLQAVVDTYKAEAIPLHYLQLDSWWYHKTLTGADGKQQQPKNSKLPEGDWNRYGGTVEYKAHPFIFPDGMEAFHESTGLPFMTHNRWIDPTSPYHDRYKISGIAAVDPAFWDEIDTYLKANGVIAYEQDWLNQIMQYSPEVSSTVETGDAFFDGMANAAKKRGMSLQYCMGTPRCFLEGSKYANLTSIRVSDDRFQADRYRHFLYTSRLASALGIWPWVDVFKSTETDNLLLSTLSAGPVGTGDALGKEDRANILLSVRADGVIVKPDAPLLPVDAAYVAEAQNRDVPLLATTHTNHGGLKTLYGVIVKKSKTGSDTLAFTAADVGCTGPAYFYDYFAGTGQKIDKAAGLSLAMNGKDCAYFVAAPIGSSGIAFLGDAGKFVGTGKKRIAALHEEGAALTADVLLAANEPEVVLHGYAAAAPEVSASPGEAGPVAYDAATGLFSVTVKPGVNQPATMIDGDSARKLTVTMRSGKVPQLQ